MAGIEFDEQPYEALNGLYSSGDPLGEVVDGWLDAIERNPRSAEVRKRLIRPGQVWAVSVRDPRGQQDWMLLWGLDGDTPVVRYLGPERLGSE